MSQEVTVMVNHGDRLTDWSQGKTFYVARVGHRQGATILMGDDGHLHRLEDCTKPAADYNRLLTEEELALVVESIEGELAGDASHLLDWLQPLSFGDGRQRLQVWERLSPKTRLALQRLKSTTSQEVGRDAQMAYPPVSWIKTSPPPAH
jgi:hypothetical protein